MSDPIAKFKRRIPSDISSNPKAGQDLSSLDTPSGDDPKLPTWAKWIVGCNLIMVHLVVMLVGIEDVPFTLNDAALAAYVVTGLGIPVGLASRVIRSALASIFGIKS